MPKTDAPVDIEKTLPDDWDEDDRLEYKILCADSKKYFPKMDDFIIHISVIAYINDKKGKRIPATEEQIRETMNKYDNETTVIYTPYDSNFYEYELPKIIKEKDQDIIIHNNTSNLELEYSSNIYTNILSNDIIE
jgi:hypothetical protein